MICIINSSLWTLIALYLYLFYKRDHYYFVLCDSFTSQIISTMPDNKLLRKYFKKVQSYFHIDSLISSHKIVESFISCVVVVNPLLLPPVPSVEVSQGSALGLPFSLLSPPITYLIFWNHQRHFLSFWPTLLSLYIAFVTSWNYLIYFLILLLIINLSH